MKEVTIIIPRDKTAVVVNFLQDEVKIRHLQLFAGVNCCHMKVQVPKPFVGTILRELDKIGCGVVYGMISVTTIHTIKPVPRSESIMKGPFRWQTNNLSAEEVHADIDGSNRLDLNYIAMMTVASVIAGVGLMTDNVVMIVSSMLVSALMGPILGLTFGCVIKDWDMVARGALNEFIGVMIALVVGIVIGLLYYLSEDRFDWPTEQMASRGTLESLVLGTLYAFPSGIGVGISVTDGGINGLVGVAIAASLLPPVTNAGMCISYGLLKGNSEVLDIGGFSLALFAVNCITIIITGYGMFSLVGIATFRRKSSAWKGFHKVEAGQMADPSFHTPQLLPKVSNETLTFLAGEERGGGIHLEEAKEATISVKTVQRAMIKPIDDPYADLRIVAPIHDSFPNPNAIAASFPNSIANPLSGPISHSIAATLTSIAISIPDPIADIGTKVSFSDAPVTLAIPQPSPKYSSKEVLKSPHNSGSGFGFALSLGLGSGNDLHRLLKQSLSDISFTLGSRKSVYNTLTRFLFRVKRFLVVTFTQKSQFNLLEQKLNPNC
jgi:uncharacterized hydrophobic protein (TIGR00271 family)